MPGRWDKRYAGPSRDGRTNRWVITCPRGHSFTPPTTLLRVQVVTCPRCVPEASVEVDYDGPEQWADTFSEGAGGPTAP